MKLKKCLLVFGLFLGIISCKNFTKNNSKKGVLASVPRYDSINWQKAYKFGKINQTQIKEKSAQINRFFKEQWLPSSASGGLIVAWHGQIIFEGYNGYADIENKIPVTAETPIHIASVSKVLTAMAVLKLVQFGKIDLNQKVDSYLNGFPYTEVKVSDLLNHRSGMPDYLHLSDDKKYWDNTQMMSNQDVLEMLIRQKPPVDFPSGKKFAYSNTNFVLLALIIEKVTGASYPEVMKYMIFDPLKMTDTFVMEFDKDSGKVSKSYYNNGGIWNYDHLDKTYGDKNIYSTPRDLLKLDIAMYSSEFLPDDLKNLAWKGYSYETKGVKNYGFGMRMYEWDNGDKLLYHKGLWHGNRSTYVRDFRDEVCVIALGNRKNKSIYDSMGLVSLFYNYPFPNPLDKPNSSNKRGSKAESVEAEM